MSKGRAACTHACPSCFLRLGMFHLFAEAEAAPAVPHYGHWQDPAEAVLQQPLYGVFLLLPAAGHKAVLQVMRWIRSACNRPLSST